MVGGVSVALGAVVEEEGEGWGRARASGVVRRVAMVASRVSIAVWGGFAIRCFGNAKRGDGRREMKIMVLFGS